MIVAELECPAPLQVASRFDIFTNANTTDWTKQVNPDSYRQVSHSLRNQSTFQRCTRTVQRISKT